VNVNRENSLTEGQLTLTFNDGLRMQAGAFVGAYVAGGLTLTLQIYLPRPWWKVWAFTWQNLFTVEKDFKVDLLDLMFKLITYLLSKRANTSSFTQDSENRLKETQLDVKTFNLAGSSSAVTPNLTATPQVTAPLNLANYVPKLREANLALAKVDGEISFGPSVHLQYPVTFNFNGFTVTGGVEGAPSADYGNVQYLGGNRVSAKGNTLFNTLEIPSRFTTHVKYQTTVKLVISIHFRVKLAKFFNLEVNTPSLDLTYLLFRIRESNRTVPVDNSVATAVEGGCVLTPNMTLQFLGPSGPGILIQTGERGEGLVSLAGFRSSSAATVALEIEPPVANFPSSVTIPAGSQSATFSFTFPNQCLPTGNRNDPSETAPPSPIAPVQTYLVRAKLTPPSTLPCSDYQVEAPLNIMNRFIRCQRFRTAEGTAPPWDMLAGATIKADIDDPRAPTGGSLLLAVLWFPYVSNEQPQTVPVTFTLLDENRQPYSRSDVELIVTNTERKFLAPSCTLNVRILTQEQAQNTQNGSIAIHWNSKGRHTGYSNRFYLLVDAGCQFGQTEFWLDVFNWS
jgi:hypothetical protein